MFGCFARTPKWWVEGDGIVGYLTIEIQVGGARPRNTKVTRSIGFSVDQNELSEGRYERQTAFQTLAKQVSGDAVEWILYVP